MSNLEELICNVKSKQICRTKYGNSKYSYLWYCDVKNKVCITFTPRGGCSISFQQYLDLVGLLKDGLNYHPFIHVYRNAIFDKHVNFYNNIGDLIKEKYTFIKFIMNPYIRAISIYRLQESHNLSFREYLIQLLNNKTDYFTANDKFHYHPQYIDGEEKIITKYIKIDKNETFQINLSDESLYTFDVNKYTSIHHGVKDNKNVTFCGDLQKDVVNKNLPKSYKYFYDDEIRKMVETFYKKDIEHYGYSFDDFN
jgi:hypothetical protein